MPWPFLDQGTVMAAVQTILVVEDDFLLCEALGVTVRSRHQQYLADVLAGFHQPVRLRRLAQRELPVGERAQFACGPHRPDLFSQRGNDRRLLRNGARAQRRTGNGEMLALDRAKVRLDLGAGHQRHEAQPAFTRQQFDLARDVVAADHIEDRTDTASARGLLAHRHEILRPVVDRDVGAEVTTRGALLVRARGRQHSAAERLGKLDRGDADPAGAALNKKCLARSQVHPFEHVGPHRAERLRQPAGIDQADTCRNRQALHRRHRGVLAVAVADHQRADLVAVLPLSDAWAEFHHDAGAFQAGNVGRTRRHRVAAHALQAVCAVDAGAGNADQHLAGFRFRYGTRGGHQHLGAAGLPDLDDGLRGGDVGEHVRSSDTWIGASGMDWRVRSRVWQIGSSRARTPPVVLCRRRRPGDLRGRDRADGGFVAGGSGFPGGKLPHAVPGLAVAVRLHRLFRAEDPQWLVQPAVSGAAVRLRGADLRHVLVRLGVFRRADRVRVPSGTIRAGRDHRRTAADPHPDHPGFRRIRGLHPVRRHGGAHGRIRLMAYYTKVLQPDETVKVVGQLHWSIYLRALFVLVIALAMAVGSAW